jgi:hypothetical protein
MKQLLLIAVLVLLVFGQVGGLGGAGIGIGGSAVGGPGDGSTGGIGNYDPRQSNQDPRQSNQQGPFNQGFPGGSGLDAVPADIRRRAVQVTPEVLNSLSVIAPGLRNSVPTSPGPNDQKYGGPSSQGQELQGQARQGQAQSSSFGPIGFWKGHWILYIYCDWWWPFCCHFFWIWVPW